jgi:hypothetical protein
MKTFNVIILLLITITAQAQHIEVVNNKLQWQKVYNTDLSQEEVLKALYLKGVKSQNSAQLMVNFTTTDLEPYGFKSSKFATYIQLGGNYTATLEFKQGKYRVTVNNIMVRNLLNEEIHLDISEFMVRRGQLRTGKSHQKVKQLLEAYFTEFFKVTTNDW